MLRFISLNLPAYYTGGTTLDTDYSQCELPVSRQNGEGRVFDR
jgi:hypothetical protein